MGRSCGEESESSSFNIFSGLTSSLTKTLASEFILLGFLLAVNVRFGAEMKSKTCHNMIDFFGD